MAENEVKNRFKPAFGSSANIQSALDQGLIDAHDILLLDGNTNEPKIGWVDKDGKPVIVDTEKVVVVEGDSLPDVGEQGKIYIFNGDGYFWDGNDFINLCKPTDLTDLENQVGTLETEVTELETELDSKVDEPTVQAMIKEYACIEIVEF